MKVWAISVYQSANLQNFRFFNFRWIFNVFHDGFSFSYSNVIQISVSEQLTKNNNIKVTAFYSSVIWLRPNVSDNNSKLPLSENIYDLLQ